MSGKTYRRKAAKWHECIGCTRMIHPGEICLEHVGFPDDVHDGIWRGYECPECARRYGREHLLEPPKLSVADAMLIEWAAKLDGELMAPLYTLRMARANRYANNQLQQVNAAKRILAAVLAATEPADHAVIRASGR